MKKLLFALLPVAVLIAGCSCCAPKTNTDASSLFNGRDLSGWVVMHGGEWTIADGVLTGRKGTNWSTNPATSGSWLRTEKTYGDFTLELEYAINARGNSGIFIRSGLDRNPAFTGYEMQILDDQGREGGRFPTGSLYDVVASTKNMSKPAGEWNQARIDCQGQQIRITLNGEEIVNYTGDRATRGYIGLQNHDTNAIVKFRNIRVIER